MWRFSRLLTHSQILLNLLILHCLCLCEIFNGPNFIFLVPVTLISNWYRIHHWSFIDIITHDVLRTVSCWSLSSTIVRWIASLKLILAITLVLSLHIKLLQLLSLFRSIQSCMLHKFSGQISHSCWIANSTFVYISASNRFIIIKLVWLHYCHLSLLHLSVNALTKLIYDRPHIICALIKLRPRRLELCSCPVHWGLLQVFNTVFQHLLLLHKFSHICIGILACVFL